MPLGSFGNVPDRNASSEELADAFSRLLKEVTYLLNGGLDTLNVNELHADVIIANTITASKMNVQQLSAIAADLGKITAGIIIGALIKTAETGERIELAEGKIRTYNDFNNLNGVQWGNFEGYNFGDLFLYSNGTLAAQIARTLGEWYIHGIGTNSLHLGSPSESNVLAEGSWDFNGETGFNGNVYLAPSAARVGAYTQANSTATDVAGIVSDFNTLLSNLKNMGIIN